jgi:hypothetical protein
MMRLALILACLATIAGRLAYAGYRERTPNLKPARAAFQAINTQYFDGQLPTPVFRYADLPDALATTIQGSDGRFLIELRPGVDLSVLRHEACHIFTWDEDADHGPQWTACMERFAK